MTDKCFICLEKARKNMCPARECKLKCHSKCYKLYISNSYNIDMCPVCKKKRKKHTYNLRCRYKKVDINEFAKIVENMLVLIESTHQGNKKNIVIEMFKFIEVNLWVFNEYEKFKNIVKKKLYDFYKESHWEHANKVHKSFFGEYIY